MPRADERRVERILEANGIAVTREYPQRSQLDARANVRTLARFFHVGFRGYPDSTGSRFLAPTREPAIPRSLRPYVTGVVGLDTRPLAISADLPHGALRPPDAALAYDVAPLHQAGIDGTGQAIAIVSLEAFPPDYSKTQDDVSTFRSTFGAKGPAPVDVKVDGGGSTSDFGEDDLDLDVISAIAPGAQIINYEAPKSSAGLVDVFSRVVSDGRVKIASFSWGICDAGMPAAVRKNVENALRLAVLRGITVFVASGDSGSYDCQRSKFSDHRLTVDFPSDSPQVVSVGGTLLSVQTSGAYGTESAWEGPFSNSGGGGGINTFDAAPSWQAAAHVGNGQRVVPGRVREREPDERLAGPRLRQLGLVRRHERGDAVLGGLDAAVGATRGEAGRQTDVLPRADPLQARLGASALPAVPRRASPAGTGTTTRARAGTTPPASARPTSTTSPATSSRTSALTRAGPARRTSD